MKEFSRRALLQGIGQSAAVGSLAAMMPGYLPAAQAAAKAAAPGPTNICLSMIYPIGEGLTFNADAFHDRHMPILKSAYAGGLERVELRIPAPAAEGAAPAPFLAAVSMWISDFNKFATGANAHAKEVAASMATITKSAPMAQFDSVVGGAGGDRASIVASTKCLTEMYEAKEGATWDAKGFAEGYLPRLAAAYGPVAVQRIEVVEGLQNTNGTKPLLLGTVNFYVADTSKFVEAAASDAIKQLLPEEAKYRTNPPIRALMQVHSIG